MDIYQVIARDHSIISHWIQHLNQTPEHAVQTKQMVVDQLLLTCDDLSKIQYLTFYLPVKLLHPLADPTVDSVENHKEINELLLILKSVAQSDLWNECWTDFKRLIENHITQEQAFLFFQAKERLDSTEALELANAYEYLLQRSCSDTLDSEAVAQSLYLFPKRFAEPLRTVFAKYENEKNARSA